MLLALMSALPPKADIGTQLRDVCFVPKADISASPYFGQPVRFPARDVVW
jgi:hypothetical protein